MGGPAIWEQLIIWGPLTGERCRKSAAALSSPENLPDQPRRMSRPHEFTGQPRLAGVNATPRNVSHDPPTRVTDHQRRVPNWACLPELERLRSPESASAPRLRTAANPPQRRPSH